MVPAYSVEAQVPGVQGKNATRELNNWAHQKYELRRQLQFGSGPVRSSAVDSHTTQGPSTQTTTVANNQRLGCH